ncbi:asparagine synthetase B family protein [Gloeothece verrucosa]|uniref:asparagine synthase (glutamine-hydrolyzing) n=1 Tax=Gloeothece verrucosa (strain PCC 7822) TaxID=497965 RepID=E0UMT6_GLOV7|nr:asparagine synthase-related protein [Gloeothece verrucosa]ADN18266.1 asparagine synthase [Gloeothece verrucosa PCC 7822]
MRKRKSVNLLSVHPSWCLIWGQINTQLNEYSFSVPGKLGLVGSQPVFSPQKGFLVVGDVWLVNRDRVLRSLGVSLSDWKGTDEEVVAFAWERWGTECVKQFMGFFALIVWDVAANRLWLVRDSVGVRTLYYCYSGSSYYIAPRLKNLSSFHSQQLDLVALRDYLSTAFVAGERTLWEQVKELLPGTILSLSDGKINRYWQPIEQILEPDQSLAWYSNKLRDLLEQVIREYLPQNESVGVYLSGGLDSSCVTALAARLHSASVHTYSIFFGADSPHELEFSSQVAQFCRTEHHILEITPQQMWNQLPETMAHLDDPIGDPLTVPNYLMAQLAGGNVQVILNGEGGDPCFGGPKNQPMLLNQLYNQTENQSNLMTAYLTSFQKCFLDLPRLLKPDVLAVVESSSFPFEADLNSETTYLNRLMCINIKFKGADHILTKVNNLTRSALLEGRSPLFDRRIVELAMQIPPQYKLAGAEEKAVLKQAVIDLLPIEIIKRPKSGMMVPVQLWFKKYWQREARKLLLNKNAKIAPYFNQKVIRDWLNYQGDPWGRYGVKLWLLLSLEIWLEVNQ